MHRFHERLQFSHTEGASLDWDAFYRAVWGPLVLHIEQVDDLPRQKMGLDRVVYLEGGRTIRIDEKIREKDYGDVLVEMWSVWLSKGDKRNKLGWARDPYKRCDFIAYAVPSAGFAYLLPFELLRLTCTRQYLDMWRATKKGVGRVVKAYNDGYTTISFALPWDDLFRRMKGQSRIGVRRDHTDEQRSIFDVLGEAT